VGSLSQFEENVDPLLRGHLSAGKGVRGIGCFEGVENADYFLHSFILPWLPRLRQPSVVLQNAAVHHHFEARLPRPPRGLLMVHPDRLRALAEGGLI
jgi:hypothetical protein